MIVNWEQLQYLAFYGALHSASLTLLTEWLKSSFKIGDVLQRWVPLFISLPSTFALLPTAIRSVGITMEFSAQEAIGIGLFCSVCSVGGSAFCYNLARLLHRDVINALRHKISGWANTKPKDEEEK